MMIEKYQENGFNIKCSMLETFVIIIIIIKIIIFKFCMAKICADTGTG